MRILALQLKRIGDLILTTPALRLAREFWPEAHIALAVEQGTAPLLGAIDSIDAGLVFGRGRGFAPWQQVLGTHWDLCLDFTGTDRSALITALSRARKRTSFASVRRKRLRSLAYSVFLESSVRERHTVDHYLDLVGAAAGRTSSEESPTNAAPVLRLSSEARSHASELLAARGISEPFAILHAGAARAEKRWITERWAEVARTLQDRRGLQIVLTGGDDAAELEHVAAIEAAGSLRAVNLAGQLDLLALAALVARARLVISCDTALVHLAAAFRTPQVALFGPTNPFHWRPRHDRAVVLSAASSHEPLTHFTPKMKGAAMEDISTALVLRASEWLLGPSEQPSVLQRSDRIEL